MGGLAGGCGSGWLGRLTTGWYVVDDEVRRCQRPNHSIIFGLFEKYVAGLSRGRAAYPSFTAQLTVQTRSVHGRLLIRLEHNGRKEGGTNRPIPSRRR